MEKAVVMFEFLDIGEPTRQWIAAYISRHNTPFDYKSVKLIGGNGEETMM